MSRHQPFLVRWGIMFLRTVLLVAVLSLLAVAYKVLVDGLASLSDLAFRENALAGIGGCLIAAPLISLLMVLLNAFDSRQNRPSPDSSQ